MKKTLLLALLCLGLRASAQVQTTYLWHLHQPTYWGDKSKSNPNRSQLLKESQDLKLSGQNTYSDGLAHPLNNLEEIFSLSDRVNAYQYKPKNAISSISQFPKAGAQITYGGSLIESINSLAPTGQWGYQPNWASNITTAKSWLTSGGKPRMDVVNFTMHHSLSPLLSDEVLKKEIQAFKYYATQTFGSQNSKGYWPAECAFTERIIKPLVEEGIEWSVVANSHLARTLADYPLVFGTNGCNIDPPNKADKTTTVGTNWHNGQIDGRGGQFAAPYCFTPHKSKYVDPNTGTEYKIDIVPMADLDSYRDGYSQQGIGNLQTNIAPFSPASRPSLMLLAHDGDNAWGGGSSYYDEAVPGFTSQAAGAGYVPTTIQQYLTDFPVPATDIVHIEDGSWFNAANDWGSPQFINWLWPMYTTPDYEFNINGWTEDVRNQAVMVAAENHCIMAEQLEGGVQIADIVNPTASASPAEKAWHFYMPGLDSGNAYYGDALDLEIKATVAANNAISFAQPTLDANAGVDNTKPSVFIPQRYPYNPGEIGFGPNYGYTQKLNSADFTVWTLAYDVSGIQSATLKYRIDADGTNPLSTNQNETYAGGSEVGNWVSLNMVSRIFPKDNVTNNPNISLFILPTKIATQYSAKISGISEKLVDYYIEIVDTKGNTTKTAIQHTWVGKNLNINPVISFDPATEYSATALSVIIKATDSTDPNPKLYYTTDGSTPTQSSASATSTVTLNITQTTTIKVFAKDVDGNLSAISTKTYTIGAIPNFTVHFKAPTAWTSPKIHYWNALPTGNLTATTWPGVAMTPECDGWYRYTFSGVTSTNIIFNNGSSGTGNQTADLSATGNAWYDGTTSAWVSEPAGFNTPCVAVSPVGGTFTAGSTVNVTVTARDNEDSNPKIYYTLDGSTPTTASTVATGSASLAITSTKTLKILAIDSAGNSSAVRTETYTIPAVTTPTSFTVYFKAPTAWTSPKIHYWNALPAGSLAATTWPGVAMTAICDGWYKYTFTGVTSTSIIFNNGSSGTGNQTADLSATGNAWYDGTTSAWITEPSTFNTPCIAIAPAGGTFNTGTTVNVAITAKDNADANPVIYYTLDGSTPTTTSTSATGSVTIPITATKTLKAFVKDNTSASSAVKTETYTFQTTPSFTVYFKPPTSWTTRKIHFWNAVPTGSVTATTWPGVDMTVHKSGWYKYTFTGVTSISMIFNNGNSGVGTNQTANITGITGEIWYDWTSGIVPNPNLAKIVSSEPQNELLHLYPNPSKGILNIVSSLGIEEVSIYANTGNLVKNIKLKEKIIDISDLPSGIYIVKLIANDSKIMYKQIIKE